MLLLFFNFYVYSLPRILCSGENNSRVGIWKLQFPYIIIGSAGQCPLCDCFFLYKRKLITFIPLHQIFYISVLKDNVSITAPGPISYCSYSDRADVLSAKDIQGNTDSSTVDKRIVGPIAMHRSVSIKEVKWFNMFTGLTLNPLIYLTVTKNFSILQVCLCLKDIFSPNCQMVRQQRNMDTCKMTTHL